MGPQGIQYPRFLAQLTFTHYILRFTSFWTPLTPPICLKMPKCAIFGTFWLFHFGNTLKVGVHREKFNIGKVAQIFFGGSYICWDWHFSTPPGYPGRCGKMPNHSKIAVIFFLKLGFWQIDVFTKYCCWNSSKRPQMPQKWIRTILFGSGCTLDTLNRGLGPFFLWFSMFLAPWSWHPHAKISTRQ